MPDLKPGLQARKEISPDVMIDAVGRLVVCHLKNVLSTPIDIPPAYLRTHDAIQRFETTDPNDIRAAFESVIAATPVLDSRRRYSLGRIFYWARR